MAPVAPWQALAERWGRLGQDLDSQDYRRSVAQGFCCSPPNLPNPALLSTMSRPALCAEFLYSVPFWLCSRFCHQGVIWADTEECILGYLVFRLDFVRFYSSRCALFKNNSSQKILTGIIFTQNLLTDWNPSLPNQELNYYMRITQGRGSI